MNSKYGVVAVRRINEAHQTVNDRISKKGEKGMKRKTKINKDLIKHIKKEYLLSEETILESGIKEIPVHEAEQRLGCKLPDVVSICQIPYEGSDFCRYRALYANGKLEWLPKVWSPRPYIPRKARKHFGDVEKALLILENEFEALDQCEYGECAIAFTDLGSFSQKMTLPDDFDQIALLNREIIIIPSFDWLDSVKRSGCYETDTLNPATLANKLNERGAIASIFFIETVNEDGTLDFENGFDEFIERMKKSAGE